MPDAPQCVIRVDTRGGRRRYIAPHDREISPTRIARWRSQGLLQPLERGLLDETPQSYLYTGKPPTRWRVTVS
jgi:hypothetical protein